MSEAKTAAAEAPSDNSEKSEYSHLHGTTGVLTMNGEEIELSYSDILKIRGGLLHEKWRHAEEDRPSTAQRFYRLYEKVGPAVGRGE